MEVSLRVIMNADSGQNGQFATRTAHSSTPVCNRSTWFDSCMKSVSTFMTSQFYTPSRVEFFLQFHQSREQFSWRSRAGIRHQRASKGCDVIKVLTALIYYLNSILFVPWFDHAKGMKIGVDWVTYQPSWVHRIWLILKKAKKSQKIVWDEDFFQKKTKTFWKKPPCVLAFFLQSKQHQISRCGFKDWSYCSLWK